MTGEVWAAIAAFVTLTVGLFSIWRNLGKRMEDVEKGLGDRLDRTGERIRRVETRLGRRVERMEGRLLDAIRSLTGHGVAESRSPIVLTDLGKKVSDALGAKEWVGRLAPPLADKSGKLNYEIQDFAFRHMEDVDLNPDELSLVKQVAYDNGLNEYSVRRVLAIELRDKLLAIADLEAPE